MKKRGGRERESICVCKCKCVCAYVCDGTSVHICLYYFRLVLFKDLLSPFVLLCYKHLRWVTMHPSGTGISV